MKAVAPRIEKLYASEAERWHDAWDRFHDMLWSHLTRDEEQAYAFIYAPDRPDGFDEIDKALARIMRQVHEERDEDPPGPEEDERHHAFMEAFLELALIGRGEVDLERWPEDVPYPPDSEDLESVRREEGVLLRVCRSEKGKGEAERQAAAWIIFNVAVCKTARVYSNEGSKG